MEADQVSPLCQSLRPVALCGRRSSKLIPLVPRQVMRRKQAVNASETLVRGPIRAPRRHR
ncbi:hypothetical protein J6590_061544 [Homalodisca vitripennis]|nr:hypothetical protein J6590_061544 [Homalodisca vitripennis]